jgi:aspartate aminotransferase
MSQRYPFAAIKEKLHERGDRVIDFAIGARRLSLPDPIDDWIHANTELVLRPSNHSDMDAFREAAARFMQREYAVDVGADCILPTPGGRAGMSAFAACTLNPDDTVAVTVPGYPAFARLAMHRHAEVIELPLLHENMFAPDVRHSDLDVAPHVVAVNYPNNPTGAVFSPPVVAALECLSGPETLLFNDATYGPLVYRSRCESLLGQADLANAGTELVELHSISKMFPLGPIAASFLVGSPTTMREVSIYSEYAWSPLSKLQLEATTMCLDDRAHLEKLREFFPNQIRRLRETLSALGFQPLEPDAGVYVICPVPGKLGGRTINSAGEAATVLLDEFDVAVYPAESADGGYLRFTSMYLDEQLEQLAGLGAQLQPG